MNNLKLLKILRTFSISEFKECEKFVDSSFFSHGRDLSIFFKSLKPFYPEFEGNRLNRENIFKNIYPEKIFDEKTSANIIYKLSSELYKLCMEFLIQIEFRKDISRKQFYLLNQLREKKLYKEFDKEYKNPPESLTDNNIKGSANDLLNKYYLKHSFLEYCIETGDIKNAIDSILTLGEYLTAAALIKGFRNIDTNLTGEKFNIKTRYNLIDNFIKHLDSEKLLNEMKINNDSLYPNIAISYAIHAMFKDKDIDEHYFKMKNLFLKHISLFGHTERYILFQILISYCSTRIEGLKNELFFREEFDVYRLIFKLGVYKYSDSDKIQINNFRSIIICAVDNKEIDWLEYFVTEFISELDIVHRENMMNYSYAYIYFEKKDYEKALDCIMKVRFDFVLFKMDVKNILFKIYFEMGYYEQAYSMLDTMKHYIANTKDISEFFKLKERNFIKYASELLKAKSSQEKAEMRSLKNKIDEEKFLSSRYWLLRKVNE